MTGRELPPERHPTTADEVAFALRDAIVAAGLRLSPELLGLLLAQSGGETGGWVYCYAWNLGNAKASDAWIAGGGDYCYHDTTAPGQDAPVSEWLPRAQADAAVAAARPRTDGVEGMDAQVVSREGPRVYMRFYPSHYQARFRAWRTLEEGAAAFVALLQQRFPEALAAAGRGDVAGYVLGLRARGYFTAPVELYLRGVRANLATYLPVARRAVASRPPDLSDGGAFRSRPDDLTIHWAGWHRLASGDYITRLPVWDEAHGLFARPGWGQMEAWLEARGMRLPTWQEMEELHRVGLFVEPLTMPTMEQLEEAGIPQSTTAINAFRSAHMMSHAWCWEHDQEVWRRLLDAGWDGQTPVANAGKHWVQGGIHGWWRGPEPAARKWQPFARAHRGEPDYGDYGTTSHAVIEDEGKYQLWQASLFDLAPVAHLTFAERAVHWLGGQQAIDPREIPGPVHHPLILSYSRPCRRGGRAVELRDGKLVWDGGASTAAPSDEWDWCAILQSGRLLEDCLLEGEAPPHGARVACWELVEDLRAQGRLHLPGSGYTPKAGDLAFEDRAGQSPLARGTGHVWCLLAPFEEGAATAPGMGGNEGQRIRYSDERDLSRVVAWGER